MNLASISRLLATNGGWHAAVLRIPIGMIFVAYGAQKLFGWFGGYGPSGTGQWMESVGLSPGYAMAVLAGSAEFFGGLELIVGFLVRPAALVLAVTMAVALSVVHWRNGLFISNNGYEYALALLGVSAALAISGTGRLSIDHALTSRT